jgi:D-glycero-D-manno-heptose 1,7-bisphosphate phosphatase
MLLQAAADLGLDLPSSYTVGDKRSDVLAGKGAGCRTVLVRTGKGGSGEPGLDADDPALTAPDFVADDLLAAAAFLEPAHR